MTKDQYTEAVSIYECMNRKRKEMEACEKARKRFSAAIYALEDRNDKEATEYVKEIFEFYITSANKKVFINVLQFLCKRLHAKERKARIDMFFLDKGIQNI